MNDDIIKLALSYDLGSDLHEDRRLLSKTEDGSYKPRIKKSTDEEWNKIHGTDEVDIANCTFENLPSNWQHENLEAAKVVINLVFDNVITNKNITKDLLEEKAVIVHEEWLKRNEWVFDPNNGNPSLAVPFSNLSKEEKDKDINQLKRAIKKIEDYKNGLIDIDELCFKYSILI